MTTGRTRPAGTPPAGTWPGRWRSSRRCGVRGPWCFSSLILLQATRAPVPQNRYALLRTVALTYKDAGAEVYLDAGSSNSFDWGPNSRAGIAERLVASGVQEVAGFFTNVANFQTTAAEVAYGNRAGAHVRVPAQARHLHRDPIWPSPQRVDLPAILGGHVTVLGHPLPTVVAEKTVTVLQRGTTSTRWRDYVDVRGLSRTYPFLAGDLRSAAQAVADHRQVELGPLAAVTAGYGDVAQPKWSAWLRTNDMTDLAEPVLNDQLAAITAFVDPVYDGTVNHAAAWNPTTGMWEPGDAQASGEFRRWAASQKSHGGPSGRRGSPLGA
ncbi:nucleotidyl transferase AbiEii/AbiGii toxin family protein [Cellulomonas xiejunii]|uniref:Nucleotidyl transferase AbiEii/AbiGii toxin family protein n=1 Tax=Cellulomonas xiejunii TaxID=2968083 RepID=A0ABY5KLF4_9CELL|nr:nucleotidyl transferase AbiEii/AbiGii toxin family protein [Cellulomonas xiejunii]UUI71342.1 nucleotidyl transferase AbiEii/AbiGii toxin family protein [Cellulomonas xiejunii]